MSAQHRFVLQAVDQVSGCPVLEAQFSLDRSEPLQTLLGEPGDVGAELGDAYDLDVETLEKLSRLIGFSFPNSMGLVRLVRWHPLRSVPYLIHTGFELPLMLEGRKPLAVFCDAYPSEWFQAMIARFDPYVADKRFIRQVVDEPFSAPAVNGSDACLIGLRYVYITLPDQEWRIESYIRLMRSVARSGWTEALERCQGELLGYEDWQCDWWATERKALLTARR